MDRVVLVIATLSLIAIAGVGGIYLRRWSKAGYRFRLKALLYLTAAASVLAYVTVEFLLPRMQRQWAVHVVQQSRGSFYRGELKGDSVEIFKLSDPWSEKEAVEFDNDFEATSSANVLRFLPELRLVHFNEKVTDRGISSVLASQEKFGIRELSFQCPMMTDASIKKIGQMDLLESIMFVSSGITDNALWQLHDVKGLRSLWLHENIWEKGKRNRNRFGPSGYEAIGGLKNLKNARIRGYVVTDNSALQLHTLASIEKLDFVWCIISNEALTKLRLALPECEIKAIHCVEPDDPKPDWF